MKVRAHPIVRGSSAVAGLAFMALGLRWASAVLEMTDGRSLPEHLVEASSADLVAVAAVSVPLLALGVVIVARAPLLGVTCTHAEVRVHKAMWTRRVPTDRIIEIRRTWSGKTDLWWKGEAGWPRWTRVPAFSVYAGTSRMVLWWLEPYNEQRVGILRRWIDEGRAARSPHQGKPP